METPYWRILWASLAVIALVTGGCTSPEQAGHAEADRDIAAGVLRLKTYGLPSPSRGKYAALLKDRHGILTQGVAGCDIDEQLRRRVDGYNRRMEQEISTRFGGGTLGAILAEARKESQGKAP